MITGGKSVFSIGESVIDTQTNRVVLIVEVYELWVQQPTRLSIW